MRRFVNGQDWLTVVQLPAYAPELNPVEGMWSLLRRGYTANVAFTSTDHRIRTVRQGLRKIQYRPPSSTAASQKPDSPSNLDNSLRHHEFKLSSYCFAAPTGRRRLRR
jgi:hypothetical protein